MASFGFFDEMGNKHIDWEDTLETMKFNDASNVWPPEANMPDLYESTPLASPERILIY